MHMVVAHITEQTVQQFLTSCLWESGNILIYLLTVYYFIYNYYCAFTKQSSQQWISFFLKECATTTQPYFRFLKESMTHGF